MVRVVSCGPGVPCVRSVQRARCGVCVMGRWRLSWVVGCGVGWWVAGVVCVCVRVCGDVCVCGTNGCLIFWGSQATWQLAHTAVKPRVSTEA